MSITIGVINILLFQRSFFQNPKEEETTEAVPAEQEASAMEEENDVALDGAESNNSTEENQTTSQAETQAETPVEEIEQNEKRETTDE